MAGEQPGWGSMPRASRVLPRCCPSSWAVSEATARTSAAGVGRGRDSGTGRLGLAQCKQD